MVWGEAVDAMTVSECTTLEVNDRGLGGLSSGQAYPWECSLISPVLRYHWSVWRGCHVTDSHVYRHGFVRLA